MAQKYSGNIKVLGAAFGLGLVIAVGAIVIGRADQGVIDVASIISKANVAVSQGDATSEDGQATKKSINPNSSLPNGGLVGAGKHTPPPQPKIEENASTTNASSTLDTASTTIEDANEEGVENPAADESLE